MPITCREPLRPLSYGEFAQLAYELMRDVFAIHNELGRFFDEKHYQRALALRRPDLKMEVPLYVSFETFKKTYYLDALLAGGGLLEFKTVETLTNRHRAQALHYLMLADLPRGLLINLRPELVVREFVNCPLTRKDRHQFHLVTDEWDEQLPGAPPFSEVLRELLADWGSCLNLSLYEEALTHFFGGEASVVLPVAVHWEGVALGHHPLRLAAPGTAFKLTAFDNLAGQEKFAHHLRRLIQHTEIDVMLWANLGRHEITFCSLKT